MSASYKHRPISHIYNSPDSSMRDRDTGTAVLPAARNGEPVRIGPDPDRWSSFMPWEVFEDFPVGVAFEDAGDLAHGLPSASRRATWSRVAWSWCIRRSRPLRGFFRGLLDSSGQRGC